MYRLVAAATARYFPLGDQASSPISYEKSVAETSWGGKSLTALGPSGV